MGRMWNVKGRKKKTKNDTKVWPDDGITGATDGKPERGTEGGRGKIRKSFWTRQLYRFEMLGTHPMGDVKEAAGCRCVLSRARG